MAIAAEALLKLRAVLDDEGFRKAQAALKDLDGQAKRTGGTIGGRVNRPIDQMDKGLQRVNNSRPMQALNRGLVVTGAGLAGAVKLAVDFENEFSGVRKQLGLDPTSPILDSYRKQLLDLSTRTPTAVATLARIATEGAKIGLRGNPLMEYVNQIQMASKAMEIPAEELVGNFNGINAAMKLNPRQGYKLLNVINALDDKLPANVNSRQILEAMSRVGSIPRVAGLKAQDTAALLAPIIGQNIAPEMAATGLKNFLLPLAGGGVALSKDKKNILAQLYGYDDPGLRFLKSQKGVIEKEIEDLKAKDGLVTNKVQQKRDKARLKELRGQLSGINKQIKERPGPGAYGGKIADDLARRMQIDPRGTIMEVIGKINQLPQQQRLGVVTELFGKESAAQIMALVNNAELLRKSFGIVDNEMKASIGSVKKEYDTLLQGAPAQLEMFKNALMAPAIEIGRTLLPALLELTRALKPMIDQFTNFIRQNPGAVQNFVKLAGAVLALKVALMGIGVVVSVFQGIGNIINALGKAGTFLGNLPRTIAGTLGAVGPMLQKLKGMFAGLGGLGGNVGGALSTALRGGASGAGGFFSGLLTAARGLPTAMMNALRGLSGVLIRALALDKAAIGLRTFFDTLRGFTPTMVMKGGQWVVPWTVRLATALRSILPVMALVGRAVAGVFSGPVGWVALLITAGVALFTFRNQIGQFAATVAPALSNAFAPLRQLFTNLGALLAPAWASIAAAFRTYVVTPIQTVWNFLVVWIGQTVAAYAITWWQGVVSGFNLYVVQPIQAAWVYLMTALRVGVQGLAVIWAGIAQAFYTYVVVPVQTAWNQLTMTLGQGVAYLRSMLSQAWQGVSQAFYQWVVQPISQAWQGLVNLFNTTTGPLRTALSSAWQGVAQGFSTYVVQPVSQAWQGLTGFISGTARNMVQGFTSAWSAVANGVRDNVIVPLQNLFDGLASSIRATFDGLLGWARNIGNYIVDRVNPVRQAAGFPPLQRFARGGYVNGPTLGLIGEGRDPREYIIPERKMAGAAMNYLNGKRGASVLKGANNIRGFASGGYVKSGSTTIGGKTVSWDDPDAANKILALYRAVGIPDNQIRFSISKPVDWTKKRDNVGRTTINGKTVRWDEKDAGRKIVALYRAAGISDNQFNLTMTAARGPVTSSRREMRFNDQPPRQQYQRNWATEPRMSNMARISRALNGVLPNAVLGSTRSSGWHGGLTNPDSWHGGLLNPDSWHGGWKSWGGRPKYGRINKDETNLFDNNRAETNLFDNNQAERKQSTIEEDRLRRFRQRHADFTIESLRKIPGLRPKELALLESSALESMGYATGGYVKKPTLAWVGEGRDSEYILPQSKMYDASMAYLAGARGMGVVNPPKFASGGVVGRSTPNRAANLDSLLERSSGLGGGSVVVEPAAINATIEVRTGDVLQFEGQQYVTLNDYQRGLREVQHKTLALMRSAQGRRATGR